MIDISNTISIGSRDNGINWSSYWTNTIMPDGHTVGWYAAGDGSATYVTKDGSDFVSEWKDLSGASHALLQATGTNQPLWTADGVLFDGMESFLKTDTFNYIQPVFVYAVVKMITWANARYIWDGYTNDRLVFYQSGVSPQVKIYAGKLSPVNGNLAMETLGIVRALYYGASSKFIIDNTTPLTGEMGSNAPHGITLGARADAAANTFGNILLAELIYRNTADDAATETAIYNYLANKYGFATI